MIKRIPDWIYGNAIWIVWNHDHKNFRDFLKKKYNTTEESIAPGCLFRIEPIVDKIIKDGRDKYDDNIHKWHYYLYLNTFDGRIADYALLHHELFHLVTYALDEVGMKLKLGVSDEAYAYYYQYLTTRIFEVLKVKESKKKVAKKKNVQRRRQKRVSKRNKAVAKRK